MKRRFSLSAQARAELRVISRFIAADSPAAAQHVRAQLRAACKMLAQNPYAGHVREDLTNAKVRFWTVGQYSIVYKPAAKPLQVARILHGARDLKSILS